MKHITHKLVLETIAAGDIIQTLTPMVLAPRQTRIEEVLAKRLESIHLVFEAPADVHNAIAAVRSAEAFGVVNIHIIAPESKAIYSKTISQSSIYWVNVHYHDTLADYLATLPAARPLLAGAKMDGEIELAKLPVDRPLVLFFGNEHRGLSDAAIEACDTSYRIPMQGMSESLNLSVSASISLYDTTRRKHELLDGQCDLSDDTYESLKARYYLNSVSSRFLPKLFDLPPNPKTKPTEN